MEIRSPNPLSDEELNSDEFSHDLIAEPAVNIQNIDPELQPEQLGPDDEGLWSWEVTSTSEGLDNTTQGHSMTDLETGIIEEQICFGMVSFAPSTFSVDAKSKTTSADP